MLKQELVLEPLGTPVRAEQGVHVSYQALLLHCSPDGGGFCSSISPYSLLRHLKTKGKTNLQAEAALQMLMAVISLDHDMGAFIAVFSQYGI